MREGEANNSFTFPILKILNISQNPDSFGFTFANSLKRKAGPDSKETKENILNSPNQISLYTQGEEFQHVWEEQKLHFIKPPALYFCNSKALYI